MNPNDDTAARYATSTADLQDIAALDGLAGQLAPQAALRRYGRQHQADGFGPHRNGGWQRLIAVVKHFYAEQKHLHELYQNRNDVSGGDALAAAQTVPSCGNGLLEDITPMVVAATQHKDRTLA